MYKNIGGHLPSSFLPSKVTSIGLIQINRHQRRNANKMQLQKDWKEEMAQNFMKPL